MRYGAITDMKTLFRLLFFGLALLGPEVSAEQGKKQNQTTVFSRDLPIEITSENGIEWQREKRLWIATGDVVAEQGDSRLFSQVLIARYRAKNGDQSKAGASPSPEAADELSFITKIEAEGEMRMETPDFVATGARGSYDVEQLLFKVLGKGSKIVFSNGVVVGSDEVLEFWEGKNMGIARGDAWVKRPDGALLKAEKLVSYFAEKSSGSNLGDLEKVDAYENVSITQKEEKISGDQGVYEGSSGIANVMGDVVITRVGEEFSGEYGSMDVNTGVAKLLALPAGVRPPPLRKGARKPAVSKKKRVRAVIDLSKRKSKDGGDEGLQEAQTEKATTGEGK